MKNVVFSFLLGNFNAGYSYTKTKSVLVAQKTVDVIAATREKICSRKIPNIDKSRQFLIHSRRQIGGLVKNELVKITRLTWATHIFFLIALTDSSSEGILQGTSAERISSPNTPSSY